MRTFDHSSNGGSTLTNSRDLVTILISEREKISNIAWEIPATLRTLH